MKLISLFVLASSAVTASAFHVAMKPASAVARHAAVDDVETDFDAPVERQIAVGNVVRRPAPSVELGPFGSVPVPAFLANAFGGEKEASSNAVNFAMDDECYLGKDGDLDECADFDPLHQKASP